MVVKSNHVKTKADAEEKEVKNKELKELPSNADTDESDNDDVSDGSDTDGDSSSEGQDKVRLVRRTQMLEVSYRLLKQI